MIGELLPVEGGIAVKKPPTVYVKRGKSATYTERELFECRKLGMDERGNIVCLDLGRKCGERVVTVSFKGGKLKKRVVKDTNDCTPLPKDSPVYAVVGSGDKQRLVEVDPETGQPKFLSEDIEVTSRFSGVTDYLIPVAVGVVGYLILRRVWS